MRDKNSQTSASTVSSFYNNKFLQTFIKFHEAFHYLNGQLLYKNFLGWLTFLISTIQVMVLSLNYKFHFGDNVSTVLKYLNFITRFFLTFDF